MANYPDINGIRYDFSSIEFGIGPITVPVLGIQAIDYKYSLKPGAVKGTSPAKLGRTRGAYESDCTITPYKGEEELILGAVEAFGSTLGLAFMETPFDIQVVYSDYLQPPITDHIVGCRIMEVTQSHKSGQEGLISKIALDTMYILPNNRIPFTNFNE